MAFKDVLMKMKRALLCCGGDGRTRSLEISSPTDVRHIDLDICMPELSQEERDYIREKASADPHRFLSLQSHPPSSPSTSPSSPTSSRTPSTTLLNAASTNLPTSLPTPPQQTHTDATLPPALRMKRIWEHTRRLSASLGSTHHAGYLDLQNMHNGSEGPLVLDLDFVKEKDLESPVSGKSTIDMPLRDCGSETQPLVGGARTPEKGAGKGAKEVDSSSESEEEGAERQPLVRA
ncbi:hypothetical protein EJ04DRAFT_576514 [Polyplosphaeria fusca]|uniref:Uncharacterized protein n=1 Tax=Polyplosphaeria fusca TaxID=682080 RepID=A0A9P4V355_9PLEO|nr:hypothetical protein EJ04DRAFT_576514 [Polyplosphaeria fusca]